MKKCVTFLSSVLLSTVLITPAFAAIDVGDAMKEMGKSYRLVMKDTDAASLKKDLASLRAAAVKAQSGVPGNMKKDAADSANRKTFTAGMTEFINQVDVASKLADEGKVPEAKAEAAKLKDLMKEYHGKLGV
ncbi:cytochrome b562 [uncultured Tolumonas sp.]|uniref:cytochrome b562 n=1 Tax=uncultured Tolumonas sp. TaxID=263765 RepID=UPI00292D24C3|nr:cytochrome b562 [uncultured Tolumonas sp.]